MAKNKKATRKLSYESDGKMGKHNDKRREEQKEAEFFNVTQNSE